MRRAVLALTVVVALPACGGAPCGAAAGGNERGGRLTGLVVEVSEECVRVRPPQAEARPFVNDAHERVSVEHLEEHRRTGEPVVVRYEVRDGVRVAVRIDDA